MNANIRALLVACGIQKLDAKKLHPAGNLVRVEKDGLVHLFVNWTTPLNSQSDAMVCKDKEYVYQVLNEIVPMPKTCAFLSPNCYEEFQQYLEFSSIDEILSAVLELYRFPIVVKPNRGSKGRGVVAASNRADLKQAFTNIFDIRSRYFDYAAVVQPWLDITQEYRIIYVDGHLVLAYEKPRVNILDGIGVAEKRWVGGRSRVIEDRSLLAKLDGVCQKIFSSLGIRFCGIDLICDANGQLYLLEINSSPGIEHLIRDCGMQPAVEIYLAVLKALK